VWSGPSGDVLGRDKWGLSRVKASAGTRPRSMAALWFRNFPLAYCSLLKTRLTTLILDETLTRLRRRSAACGARWDAHNRTAVRAAQRRLRGRLTPPPAVAERFVICAQGGPQSTSTGNCGAGRTLSERDRGSESGLLLRFAVATLYRVAFGCVW
jgi:hypothetical protein